MKKKAAVAAGLLGMIFALASPAADFNGDGRDDFGIFRERNGLWGIQGVTRFYYGANGDIPLPGRYSPGADRAAIFRPSNGLFAVRDLTRIYYGREGDVPLGQSGLKQARRRFFYDENRKSFRAGEAFGGEWDDDNLGGWSVAMGWGTRAKGNYSAVGGGLFNDASGYCATIGGGETNSTTGECSTVAGGRGNSSQGLFSTVGGGYWNRATGAFSTIPGGVYNVAGGFYSFAAGRKAHSRAAGTFTWCDSNDADVFNGVDNRWVARASGGVYFYTHSGLISGVFVPAGGNSWNVISDRAGKENLKPADGRRILDKLSRLPVFEYSLKSQSPAIVHIGPVAQDFSGFGYGETRTAINLEDADGVALAAIQGLNEIVCEQQAVIGSLMEDNRALRRSLDSLSDRMAMLEGRDRTIN